MPVARAKTGSGNPLNAGDYVQSDAMESDIWSPEHSWDLPHTPCDAQAVEWPVEDGSEVAWPSPLASHSRAQDATLASLLQQTASLRYLNDILSGLGLSGWKHSWAVGHILDAFRNE